VETGGLIVDAGGATVLDTGLNVVGGVSLTGTGGLVLSGGGATVTASGVTVVGGVTVDSSGVVVTSGGLTLLSGGMIATGGVTIGSGGFFVYDGATVYNGGLYASGGLTVNDNGLKVISGGMTVSSNGLIITGGMSIDEGGLIVTGGMTVYGNTWYQFNPTVASDERLKTNIQPLEDSLSKVSRLRGVYFSWIQDEVSGLTFDEDRHVGVIAQDVQAVLPEIVQATYGGRYLGVKYPELIPLLIEAVRELDERTQTMADAPVSQSFVATEAVMDSRNATAVLVEEADKQAEGGTCADISALLSALNTRLTGLEGRNRDLHAKLESHDSLKGQ
jgi:hypothetical protein